MLKCCLLLLSVTIEILARPYAQFRKLDNVDTTLDVSIAEYTGVPIVACLTMCTAIKLCIYTSYHEGHNVCRIHGINRNGIPSQGWIIYFKVSDEEGRTELDLMKYATASQSSTYFIKQRGLTADLALDGITNGNMFSWSCSHTNNSYSYWIMQFGMSGVVDKVDIYLRSDKDKNSKTCLFRAVKRNTNRAVMVAQSYDDAVNEVGTECGGYFGSLIAKSPYLLTIQCGGPIFGKFLRISHEMNAMMSLCEVIVYTPGILIQLTIFMSSRNTMEYRNKSCIISKI